MRLSQIVEQVYCRPWLITQTGYKAIVRIVEAKLLNEKSLRAEDSFGGLFVARDLFQGLDGNGIAWVDVYGVLGKRLSAIERSCGACDYNDLAAEIDQALELNAKGFVFTFDSPGGAVSGCPELAATIAAIEVPKVAFIDTGCSAAYWLACACDYIVGTESCQAGSIGAMIPWIDQGAQWVQAGLRWEPIVSQGSELKTAGGGPSLTDAERAYLVDMTNQIGQMFAEHVKARRGIDPADLKGGVLIGAAAEKAGLVDELGDEQTAYDAVLTLASIPEDLDDSDDPAEDENETDDDYGEPVSPYSKVDNNGTAI